jgi:hypothetical protein
MISKLPPPRPDITPPAITINVTDLMVIFDTLAGSLQIRDNASVFRFDMRTRHAVCSKLVKRFSDVGVNVRPGNIITPT